MRKFAFYALVASALLAVVFNPFPAAGQSQPALPAVGQTAPGFTLPSQDGSKISLKSFRGKYVVLYFYPKDMTPGCTIEAHNFQRDLPQYEKRNSVILGVSEDTPDSHQQFCTKEGLTFRLLADTKHKVATAYGSLGSYNGTPIANRNTFLIDPHGKIVKVWTKVNPSVHSVEVLSTIDSVRPPQTQ
ncbi:MAG: peroxiredoxin [Terracidiphilus sp.]